MAEPTVPEEVYREAAAVYTATTNCSAEFRDAMAGAFADERMFRAAVESAYRAGQLNGSDIVDAAIAYVTEPDGSDQVEHYWYQLKDAVGAWLKRHADG